MRRAATRGTVRAFAAPVFRITVEIETNRPVARLAGHLACDGVEEAERVRLSAESPLLIDTSELQSADADGLAFLAKILDGGDGVEGLSEYLAMRVRYLREGPSPGRRTLLPRGWSSGAKGTGHGAPSVMRILLLTLCFSGLVILHLEAQQFRVQGRRPLAFGTIFSGVPEPVLPTDPARSGIFRVRGPRNNLYVLTFTLPADLFGPGAALLPLNYAVDDAGIAQDATGAQSLFNPTVPYTFTMPPPPSRVFVFLGATASPSIGQQPGSYLATVVLTADCAAC